MSLILVVVGAAGMSVPAIGKISVGAAGVKSSDVGMMEVKGLFVLAVVVIVVEAVVDEGVGDPRGGGTGSSRGSRAALGYVELDVARRKNDASRKTPDVSILPQRKSDR